MTFPRRRPSTARRRRDWILSDCRCAEADCEQPARAWAGELPACPSHWNRWHRIGSLELKARQSLHTLVCGVSGCGRIARFWTNCVPTCRGHAFRWNRFHSFEVPKRAKAPAFVICTVEGCDRKRHSRNIAHCRAHYFRIRRASKKGLDPIARECAHCGGALTGNQSRFCSERCCWRAVQGTPVLRSCLVCKTEFDFRGTGATCSKECANSLKRHHGQIRRAREYDYTRPREIFYDREIFTRDDWHCQLCLKPVARNRVHPYPLAPTIDHIIPLSRGGLHIRKNVQLAHARCNCKKHQRLISELNLSDFICEEAAP